MESKYIEDLIVKKIDELAELKKMVTTVEEVNKLSIPSVSVFIDSDLCLIFYKDKLRMMHNVTKDNINNISSYLEEYFEQAEHVNVHINLYGMKNSLHTLLGNQLELNPKFHVDKMRAL